MNIFLSFSQKKVSYGVVDGDIKRDSFLQFYYSRVFNLNFVATCLI